MKAKNVTEIAKQYLKQNGYSGLFHRDTECGCPLDDLLLCGEPAYECEPGYQHFYGVDCDDNSDCGQQYCESAKDSWCIRGEDIRRRISEDTSNEQ